MADLLRTIGAGDEVDLESLLDAVSSLISRDIQDVQMLLQIAGNLAVDVPEEFIGNRREIKNRIIQFLNGNVVMTLPGIVDTLTQLQEDINHFLFPEDTRSGSEPDDDGHDVVEEVSHGLGRGSHRFSNMPTLTRRHRSTSADNLPRGKLQHPSPGGVGYGGMLPGGVHGSDASGGFGRGLGPGRGAGVGRGDGGVRCSLRNVTTRTRNVAAPGSHTSTPVKRRSVAQPAAHSPIQSPVVPIAAHRLREFKIHGKIGEPPVDGVELTGKDKDNLSYSNVMLQIQDGVVAEYTDREIVGAVLRATSDPSLRDFLVEQVIGGLTVDGLKEVLGTHYSVENATGLYKKMVRRCQRENESIQKFVQELMKMRDQVLRLSLQEGSHYSKDLMQDVFQKGVLNGLLSGEARQALRSTLKQKDLDDFDLRQEISELQMDTADQNSLAEEKPTKKTNVSVKQVSVTKKEADQVVASVVEKLDNFKIGIKEDLNDFKKNILEHCLPTTQSDGFVASYGYPQLPFWGAGGPYGYNYGFGDGGRGGSRNGGFQGGHQNRGRGRGVRGGYGGGRGGNGNRYAHPLRKPLTLCDICTQSNAVFCNHCFICGNVDHVRAGCPEKDNSAFKKPKN